MKSVFKGFFWILWATVGITLIAYGLCPPASAIAPDFTVDFQANVTAGPAPLSVQFESLATGSPISWTWGIDNQLINESTPLYTFTKPGSYTINLSVTDDLGDIVNETKINYIVVSSAVPYASVSFLQGTLLTGNPIQIIDKSTGKPVPGEYNTTSRDIHLDPNHDYSIIFEPSGWTDFLNSGDYALTKLLKNARQNMFGLGAIMIIIAFLFLRRKNG